MRSLVPVNDLRELSTSTAYAPMLELIENMRPAVQQAMTQHGKSHTQYQYTMLDNTAPLGGLTKIRNMRQALSTINRTEAALEENYHKREQSLCKAEIFRMKAASANGASKLLLLKAAELESQVQRMDLFLTGAVRKLTYYYEQYAELESQIKGELEKDVITESDLEADEERFHIMQVFHQALCAARANRGTVDNGNFIYLFNLGISGAMAQKDITGHLVTEEQVISGYDAAGDELPPQDMHASECRFLARMGEKYKGCAAACATRRGLRPGCSQIATLGVEHNG